MNEPQEATQDSAGDEQPTAPTGETIEVEAEALHAMAASMAPFVHKVVGGVRTERMQRVVRACAIAGAQCLTANREHHVRLGARAGIGAARQQAQAVLGNIPLTMQQQRVGAALVLAALQQLAEEVGR